MIKEVEELGIKYLCKCGDYKDPIKYKGSGVYWRRVLKKHNPTIKTTILGLYDTPADLRRAGEFYSNKFNIVEDASWANLIPEIGDGGPTTTGKIRAYNQNTGEERFFDSEELPNGWIRGCKRPPKSADGIERTRQFHIGRKRSEETREKMRLSTRRKRRTTQCQYCSIDITIQNLQRHEQICKGKNEKNTQIN